MHLGAAKGRIHHVSTVYSQTLYYRQSLEGEHAHSHLPSSEVTMPTPCYTMRGASQSHQRYVDAGLVCILLLPVCSVIDLPCSYSKCLHEVVFLQAPQCSWYWLKCVKL